MWHMCALNEQPQRTDQNFMQDKFAEQSVLGLYEHGTVAGTTLVQRLHSVGNTPALKTQVYTLTHLDHSPTSTAVPGEGHTR